MAQWPKLMLVMPAYHTGELAQVLAVLLPIQLLVKIPGKGEDGGSSTWASDNPVGHLDGVPSCWLQLGPDLAIAAILEVNQQIKYLFFLLSPCSSPHSVTLSNKKKKSFRKKCISHKTWRDILKYCIGKKTVTLYLIFKKLYLM